LLLCGQTEEKEGGWVKKGRPQKGGEEGGRWEIKDHSLRISFPFQRKKEEKSLLTHKPKEKGKKIRLKKKKKVGSVREGKGGGKGGEGARQGLTPKLLVELKSPGEKKEKGELKSKRHICGGKGGG